MPDVGSSQNVQTAQDTPQLNGNAGQNEEKYPDNEVRDISNFWLIYGIASFNFSPLAKVVEIFKQTPITRDHYQTQVSFKRLFDLVQSKKRTLAQNWEYLGQASKVLKIPVQRKWSVKFCT